MRAAVRSRPSRSRLAVSGSGFPSAGSWIRDLPFERPAYVTEARERAWLANSERYRLRREVAYAQGVEEYPALAERPTFKEFVALYIAEGSKRERSKRERSQVKICNSDADVMTLSVHWLRVLAERTLRFSIQYHVDQDVEELRTFWGTLLGFPPEDLRLQRKSNSGKLAGRQWRSRHGVLSVRVSDTMPRARLQAWIDLTKACWQ